MNRGDVGYYVAYLLAGMAATFGAACGAAVLVFFGSLTVLALFAISVAKGVAPQTFGYAARRDLHRVS